MPQDEKEEALVIRRLRWATVVLPAIFLLAILLVTATALDAGADRYATLVATLGLSTLGVFAFSRTVFRIIEGLQAQLRSQNLNLAQRTQQLQAIHEAGSHIVANLSLNAVLQNVADSSRQLLRARYAAVAVVQDEGIKDFITSGISKAEKAAIGPLPRGHGLLGHVLETSESYRTADIASDPYAEGFPENHPPMTSFLGIPITSGERVICNLYLADKDGGPFTEEDEEALRTLAVQAAIAIENARLYEGLKDLTRLKERERIAFDLHDGAIQSLYGIGVRLDSCIEELPETSIQLRDDLNTAVDELSNITRRIRNYILNLQTEELEERDLPDALSVLLQELSVNALMSTNLEVDSSSDEEQPQKVTPEQTRQLVGIAREALTNVLEHSRATSVTANLSFPANKLVLRIRDNGVGFPAGAPSPRGRGLRDMHERTRALGGDLLIEPQPGGGTAVTVSLDLGPGEQEEGNLGGDDA